MRLDYSFCNRPITVYMPVWGAGPGAFAVRRCVLPRAFLAPGRSFSQGSAYAGSGLTGAASKEEFLLVVPVEARPFEGPDGGAGGDVGEGIFALGSEWRFLGGAEFDALEDKAGYFTLARGVKVFDGIGPVVEDEEDFAAFIPARVDGVYEIGKTRLRRRPDGAVCHLEGGA